MIHRAGRGCAVWPLVLVVWAAVATATLASRDYGDCEPCQEWDEYLQDCVPPLEQKTCDCPGSACECDSGFGCPETSYQPCTTPCHGSPPPPEPQPCECAADCSCEEEGQCGGAETKACTCGDGCACGEAEVCSDSAYQPCGGTASIACACGDGCACGEAEICANGTFEPCGGAASQSCGCGGVGCACGEATVCSEGAFEPCGGATSKACDCGGAGCACEEGTLCGDGEHQPCGGATATSCDCGGDGCTCGEALLCGDGSHQPCGGASTKACACGGEGCSCGESSVCGDGDFEPCGGASPKACGCGGDGCQCGEESLCGDGDYLPCGGAQPSACDCKADDCECGSGSVCGEGTYQPCGGASTKACGCDGHGCACGEKSLCGGGDYLPCGGAQPQACDCKGNGCACGEKNICGDGTYQPCGGAEPLACECGADDCECGEGPVCGDGEYEPCGGASSESCACGGIGCSCGEGTVCGDGAYEPCGGAQSRECDCGGEGCTCDAGLVCGDEEYKPCEGTIDRACGCANCVQWKSDGSGLSSRASACSCRVITMCKDGEYVFPCAGGDQGPSGQCELELSKDALGLQITKDWNGESVGGPDTLRATLTVSGSEGVTYEWKLAGLGSYVAEPTADDAAVDIQENGEPSPSHEAEKVTVKAEWVQEVNGVSVEHKCRKEAVFTIVKVSCDLPVFLCSSADESASAPFIITLEPEDLPGDDEILIETETGLLFEDDGKTKPAQASYTAGDFPLTLYHDLYDRVGSYTLKLEHRSSGATFVQTYTMVRVDLDIDADGEGTVEIDGLDEELEDEPGAYAGVTNGCLKRRKELVLRQVEPSDLAGADSASVEVATDSALVRFYTVAAGGAPLAMDGNDNRFAISSLPKTLWVEATQPSAAPADIAITLTDEICGCADTVTLTAVKLELWLDVENKHGNAKPPREGATDKKAAPGKFVFVNRVDWDGDSIPDYADPEVADQRSLMPMVMEILPYGLDRNRISMRFDYPGVPDEVDLASFRPDPILHKGAPSGFLDYRKAKGGSMRIWNADDPSGRRGPEHYVATERSYTLEDLKMDREKILWLEGLQPYAGKLRVEMSLDTSPEHLLACDEVHATVVEPKLGLNTSNDHTDDKLRPGIPDVEFIIDDDDEVVKDQGEGFTWWWSRDQFRQITMAGIVDLFPIAITVQEELLAAGFMPRMSERGTLDAYIYPVARPSADRRSFLTDLSSAEAQVDAWSQGAKLDDEPSGIEFPAGSHERGYLVRVPGTGAKTVVLTFWMQDLGGNDIPVDTWRMTIKDTAYFWTFMSSRGTADVPFAYPTEADRTNLIMRYPDPHPVAGHPGRPDAKKTKHLIWIHGFNTRIEEAYEGYNELFRRLSWLGFRGNFMGLTWHGDSERSPIFSIPYEFDSAVGRGFQASPATLMYLQALSSQIGAENIDIAAHSLGNLLMFDALRLSERLNTRPIARNAISIQAAVWREAFDAQGDVTYTNTAAPIGYTEEQLQLQSWAFWFNQRDRNLARALHGRVFHSYSETDSALLGAMRLNDMLMRGVGRRWHYHRDWLEQDGAFRAPIGDKALPLRVPVLLQQGRRVWRYKSRDLNVPIGAVPENPLASDGAMRDATTLNWRATKHSDHIVVERDSSRGDAWFPAIWPWYDELLGTRGGKLEPDAAAVWIGVE